MSENEDAIVKGLNGKVVSNIHFEYANVAVIGMTIEFEDGSQIEVAPNEHVTRLDVDAKVATEYSL